MNNLKKCTCPYILCSIHGECEKCISKSRTNNELCNCMEKVAIANYGLELKPKQIQNIVEVDNSKEVAKVCCDMIKRQLEMKSDSLICFPAGSTAVETFELLVKMEKNSEIDFSKARFVALDEWLYLDDESENCQNFLRNNFFNLVNIQESQIKFFNGNPDDPKKECKLIDEYIKENGGIDFMLLGLGLNGHLGLNEPFVDWNQYSIVTDLDDTTKSVGQKYFSSAKNLTMGITLGVRHIFESKQVVLQVFGAKKAEIIKALFDSHIGEELPASSLKLMDNAWLVMDSEAASKINSEYYKKS